MKRLDEIEKSVKELREEIMDLTLDEEDIEAIIDFLKDKKNKKLIPHEKVKLFL